MLSYCTKLKDPRWQKKRLEILGRDKWACQYCGSSNSTLSVHHKRYIVGLLPWEYPDNLLITLCQSCHEDINHGILVAISKLYKAIDTYNAQHSLLREGH